MVDSSDWPPIQTPPPTHPAAVEVEALLAGCRVVDGRASGPGGQHRNKVQTAVTITHLATGLTGWASERRSRAENLAKAIFRLRVNLALEVRGHFDPRDSPSPLWQSRVQRPKSVAGPTGLPALSAGLLTKGRGFGQFKVNPEHKDFPALLAEALDILAAMKFDPRRASLLLGVSPTQLVRFVKDEPRALAWVNAQRQSQGMHTLK